MASYNLNQGTAQNITTAVISNDEPLPEADQFDDCTTSDIACALHNAANIYTSRAEVITRHHNAAADVEDDSGANEAIKLVLMWWKQVASQTTARAASKWDRETMIGSLIMCLDNIKDLEWQIL